MSEWKPISDFPFDNESLRAYLLWCPTCRCTFTGVWDAENHDGPWRSFGGRGELPEAPAYFQELPPPPEGDKQL